ncbi:MAG: DNRLRE domain-containing protein [Parcubacteria group bacterium]|jgi:hypothetical protein
MQFLLRQLKFAKFILTNKIILLIAFLFLSPLTCVAVAPILQQTIVLQDKIYPTTSYEGGYSNSIADSTGHANFTYQRAYIGYNGENHRTLVKFDNFSDYILGNPTVVSANLQMYVDTDINPGALPVSAYRITTDWGPYKTYGVNFAVGDALAQPEKVCWNSAKYGTINWGTGGGDYNVTAEDSKTLTGVGIFNFNVINAVQYWANHPSENYGIIIKPDTESPASNNLKLFRTVIQPTIYVPKLTVVAQPSIIPNIEWAWNSSPLNTIDLDNYFYDADGDTFTYAIKSSDTPTHITTSINPTTHVVTFSPESNWYGTETITFTGTAGGQSIDINQITLKVYRTVTISDQSWDVNTTKTNTFDLDDYLQSCVTPSASTIDNPNIEVSIDPITHEVSFSQPTNYIGQEAVVFSCDENGFKQLSNSIHLTINNTADFNSPPERKATVKFKNGFYPTASYDGSDANSITGAFVDPRFSAGGTTYRYQQLFTGDRYLKQQFRLLWKFDTDAWVPPGESVTVDSAQLSLYDEGAANGSNLSTSLYRLTKDWGAADRKASYIDQSAADGEVNWTWAKLNDIQWSALGGDWDLTEYANKIISSTNTWYDFDVTNLIQYWLDNPGSNYGGIIKATTEQNTIENWKKFSGARKTTSGGSTRPELTVTYHPSFIPNQTWMTNQTNTKPFDLDDYFHDQNSLDNLTYAVDITNCPHISVSIDSDNKPTFIPENGWFGTETVTFNASDDFATTVSNTIILKVVNYISIPNQRWNEGNNKTNAFDLDDYFSNSSGMTFTISNDDHPNIVVDINSNTHIVSFSQNPSWHGSEKVTFYTNNGSGGYQQSFPVILTVDKPSFQPIVNTHPRIHMTPDNITALKTKATTQMPNTYNALYANVYSASANISSIEDIRDYVTLCAFRYLSGDGDQWADMAMAQVNNKLANAITAQNSPNTGYAAVGMETYALAYDYFYDRLTPIERQNLIDRINSNADGVKNDMEVLTDMQNYGTQSWTGIAVAALATYGDNPRAVELLDWAEGIAQDGYTGQKGYFNFKSSLDVEDGALAFETRTYARRPLQHLCRYASAWNTATNGAVDEFADDKLLHQFETSGYWIMYMTTPDNLVIPRGEANYYNIMSLEMSSMAMLEGHYKNGWFKSWIDSQYTVDGSGNPTWSNYLRYPNNQLLIYQLLWYDPTVTNLPLNTAPKYKKMGPDIVARTGWTNNDTVVHMFAPDFEWNFHNALESGSFYIWKNGHPLANVSAYYDYGNSEGSLYNFSWTTRTVSRNNMLILDPDGGTWPNFPEGQYVNQSGGPVNDGGQRFNFTTADPPTSSMGRANAKAFSGYEAVNDVRNIGKQLTRGELLAYDDSKDNYLFASMDLHKAYDCYPAWSTYSPNNNIAQRLNSYKRDYLWLNDKYLLVYDRMDAINGNDQKSWLLHTGTYNKLIDPPVVTGQPQSTDGTWSLDEGTLDEGISTSSDTSELYADQGTARIYDKILLPISDYKVRRIGGNGYQAWVEGRGNYNFIRPMSQQPNDIPSGWRFEVRPNIGNNKDNILNVLYPTSTSDTMPDTSTIVGTNCVGAYIDDSTKPTVVIFTDVAGLGYSLSYADNNNSHHIITGLQEGTYTVTVAGNSSTVSTTANGVLEFDSTGGAVTIERNGGTTGAENASDWSNWPAWPAISPITPSSDLNGDGKTNIYDYAIFVGNFGKTGTGIAGDLNSDNTVNLSDVLLFIQNFGQ